MVQVSGRQATNGEKLPLRLEGRLARLFGAHTSDLDVVHGDSGALPDLHGVLPRPAKTTVSLELRIHSRAGIPLAAASVDVKAGASVFHATRLAIIAMEGYAHLGAADRQAVEARVWSRRAFATASLVASHEAN